LTKNFVVLIIGNSKSNHLGAQDTFNPIIVTQLRPSLARPPAPPFIKKEGVTHYYVLESWLVSSTGMPKSPPASLARPPAPSMIEINRNLTGAGLRVKP